MQVQLHCSSLGDGEALIVLHGLFGSADNWAGMARRLATVRRVLRVDLRNHGRSPQINEMNYPAMAADVVQLMERLHLRSADLIGHSMGGKVAMELALGSPERVRRLVAVDIAPRAYPPRHQDILAALNALEPACFHSRSAIEKALAPAIPNVGVLRFLLKNLGRDGNGVLHWKLGLAEISQNYIFLNEPILGDRIFSGPALLVRGELSDYVTEADVESFRARFPAARVETIPGAGHWPHAETPEYFASLVSSFLMLKDFS